MGTKDIVAKARADMDKRFAEQGLLKQGTDSDETMARIAAQIGEADTAEEILGGGKTIPVEDFIGEGRTESDVISILNWEGRVSSTIFRKDGSPAPFAVIFSVDTDTGEEFIISCGGEIVLAQLVRLSEKKLFPRQVRFAQRGRAYRLVSPETQTFQGDAVEDGEVMEIGAGDVAPVTGS
jgi:hypothetical protein